MIPSSENRTVGLYMIQLSDGERSFSYWREHSAARVMMDATSGAIAYADCEGETPIFSIDDAIAANAFYEGSHCALVENLQPGVKSIDDALDASQHTWHDSLY